MCAAVSGATFLITLLFCHDGIIVSFVSRYKKLSKFSKEMIILHMDNHSNSENMYAELGISSMKYHLNWSEFRMNKYMKSLRSKGYVDKDEKRGIYFLTEKGENYQKDIRNEYGLKYIVK